MVHRNILTIMLSIGCLQPATGQLQSSASIGGLAGAPMRMGFGARGISMGNSLTAVINEDVQAYYNPAVLPFENSPTAIATYSILSLDRKLNFLSYSQSLKPSAGLAFSIINSGVNNIDGRDNDGIHTETFSTSENVFSFSFGLKPDNRFALGITVKVLYYSLYQTVKSTTAAVDVGAIYLLSSELVIGAVLQDIDAKYKWDTSNLFGDQMGNSYSDNFPLRKRIGISWMSIKYPVVLSAEYEAIGSDSYLRGGIEVQPFNRFFIRAGLDQIALNSDIPAKPSIGMELRSSMTWSPAFQYAYVFEPYSPSGIHILSLSIRFK